MPVIHVTKESTMQIRSVVVVAALGLASLAHGQSPAVQWRTQDGGNGHWYRLEVRTSSLDWNQARNHSESLGGHLATITSSAEDAFVRAVASQSIAFDYFVGPWLGGFQDSEAKDYVEPAGGWRWVTGEPWFAGWYAGEPNDGGTGEDFLHFAGTAPSFPDLNWNDFGPHYRIQPRSFVVEWSADCNGDDIVDFGQCSDGSLPDYNGNNVPDCCEAGTPCTVGNYPFQWRTEDGGTGHWYAVKVPGGELSWGAARAAAEAVGGYLGCAESFAERQFFFTRFGFSRIPFACAPENGNPSTQYGPWIGGYQEPGSPEPIGGWRWLTGENFDPTEAECCNNFGCPGAEGFLHLYWRTDVLQTWNDLANVPAPCSAPISLLVEWSADCNGDGIVDYGQILDGTFADTNANGVPDTCEVDPCLGDINESGVVNGIDLAAILAYWGTDGGKFRRTDANQDGTVDAQDLAIVLGGWGDCP